MKKQLLAALMVLLLLTGCAPKLPAEDDGALHILATTYPVYLLTTALTAGVEGVTVSLLVNQAAACLHDYTLTVTDMKAIEKADVIIMNGVGLEDFMADALAQSHAAVIDSSADVSLLQLPDGDDDPHIWMDPSRAGQMLGNIERGLAPLDEGHAADYAANLAATQKKLADFIAATPTSPGTPPLITFHEGFQYFAESFHLTLLKAIEEEEGAEASASELKEIIALIGQHSIPTIFTEEHGSTATANAIARETGATVASLTMLMSGEGTGIDPYLDAIRANIGTITGAQS